MLQASTVKFLKDLKKNNNKPWFDANRKIYEAAKADYLNFIQKIIDLHGKNDPEIRNIVAKDCLFRINRDVRFSKDKSPYKSNFGASINKGGKQSVSTAGYYFHLQPGESFTGGGIWMPEKENLQKIRQEVDYNLDDFKKIISGKKFKTVFGELWQGSAYKLTRVPKGYEADNPAAEYLKLKSFVVSVPFKDQDLTSKDLIKKTVEVFKTLQPLVSFLNHSME